jgi:hypothetical protein
MSGGAREAAAAWQRWQSEAGETERHALAALIGTRCPYASLPFSMTERAGRRWLLAMLDPPPSTDIDALLAWQPGEVAAIDMATGRAHLAGEPGGHLLGYMPGETVAVFSDGIAWARAWAAARAEALAYYRRGRVPGLLFCDPPSQGLPGLLLAGRADAVTDWAALLGRRHVQFDNTEAMTAARRSLARAAGLPTLTTDNTQRKAA